MRKPWWIVLLALSVVPSVTFGHGQPEDGKIPPSLAPPKSEPPLVRSDDPFMPKIVEGVVDSFKLWQAGTTLSACFYQSDADVRASFIDAAASWLKDANLKIDFGAYPFRECKPANPSQLRISFHLQGNWSYVGSDSIRVNLNDPSLNVQSGTVGGMSISDETIFKETVLHEMGHALGFQHEHQSPVSKCDSEFNWPVIYSTYLQRYGWEKDKVDTNLRGLVRSPRLRTTPYDRQSIMHYYFPEWMFKKGQTSTCFVAQNTSLSELDRESIVAAYPADPRKQIELVKNRGEAARNILKDLALTEDQRKTVEDKINSVVTTVGTGISISGISCSTIATNVTAASGASITIGGSSCSK